MRRFFPVLYARQGFFLKALPRSVSFVISRFLLYKRLVCRLRPGAVLYRHHRCHLSGDMELLLFHPRRIRMRKGKHKYPLCLFRQPDRRTRLRLPTAHRFGKPVRPAAYRGLFKGQKAYAPAWKTAVPRRFPLYRGGRSSHAVQLCPF